MMFLISVNHYGLYKGRFALCSVGGCTRLIADIEKLFCNWDENCFKRTHVHYEIMNIHTPDKFQLQSWLPVHWTWQCHCHKYLNKLHLGNFDLLYPFRSSATLLKIYMYIIRGCVIVGATAPAVFLDGKFALIALEKYEFFQYLHLLHLSNVLHDPR